MNYTDCPNCAGSGVALGKRCPCNGLPFSIPSREVSFVFTSGDINAIPPSVDGRRFAAVAIDTRLQSRLDEMSAILRKGSYFENSQHVLKSKSAEDVRALDAILHDVYRIAAQRCSCAMASRPD